MCPMAGGVSAWTFFRSPEPSLSSKIKLVLVLPGRIPLLSERTEFFCAFSVPFSLTIESPFTVPVPSRSL